jgi:hypothetical protein
MIEENPPQDPLTSFFAWLVNKDTYIGPLLEDNIAGGTQRSALLLLESSVIDVTWTEVVYGRLVYEALRLGMKVLSQFVRYVEPTLTTPQLSTPFNQLRPDMNQLCGLIKACFEQPSDDVSKRHSHYCVHFCVSEMVVSVLHNRWPPSCGLPIICYQKCFITNLFGVRRCIYSSDHLVPFEDLLFRWQQACRSIVTPFNGFLGPIEGSAWERPTPSSTFCSDKDALPDDVDEINHVPMMTSQNAFLASDGFAKELEVYLNLDYLDRHAQYTSAACPVPPPSIHVSDHPLTIDEERHVFGRVIVIHGSTFTPLYRKYMTESFDKLVFALSPPAFKRLIRITGFQECLYFILGQNTLIEGLPFSPIEEEICLMCKMFMKRLTPFLKEYSNKNQLHHNLDLEYDADLIQFTWASPKPSAYAKHNDVNVLLCDTGLEDNNYPAEQVVVATLIIGNDWPSCVEVNLIFYGANGKQVAKIPLPKDGWHIQLHNMQLGTHQVQVEFTGDKVSFDEGKLTRGVLSLRLTGRFQPHAARLEERLISAAFPPISKRNVITVAKHYNHHNVVSCPPMGVRIGSSIQSLAPSTSDLPLVPAITSPSVNLAHARKRITLKTDSYKRHSSTRWDSPIPQLFTSSFIISVDGRTWEHLVSHPFAQVLFEKGFFVSVADHRASATHTLPSQFDGAIGTTGKDLNYDYVHFGPPVKLVREGEWEDISPGTLVPANNVSKWFNLSSTTRHQQTWSHNPDTLNMIYITALYRNDVPNLANAIRYALKLESAPNFPPEFWVGGTGGGAKAAGDMACAELGTRKADKAAPHAYVPRGQTLTKANSSLLSASLRHGVVQIYVLIDPSEASIDQLSLAPPQLFPDRSEALAVYLGVYQLSHTTIEADDPKVIQETLRKYIHLSRDQEKYSRFREEDHFKFHVKPLLATHHPVTNFHQLVVHRADSRRLRTIATSTVKSERTTLIQHLDPRDPHCVSRRDILNSFLSERGWEIFSKEGGDGSSDLMGVLPDWCRVSLVSALEAIKQSSVATFQRILRANVDSSNKVGFLSGPTHSGLSSVFRIHPMHHTVRTYDVTTLFFQVCLQNAYTDTISRCFNPNDPSIRSIFEDSLVGSILLRITGRVQPFHAWHEFRLKMGGTLPQGTIPPVTLPSKKDIPSFLDFVTRSCTDHIGHPRTMAGWTSKQFASSIPRYCRHPTTFTIFVHVVRDSLSNTIDDLLAIASKATKAMSQSSRNSPTFDEEDTRESARLSIKSLIEKSLPTDDRKGTNFISRQIVLDLEEVWDLLFGCPRLVQPGYGGTQGFSLLSPSAGSHDQTITGRAKEMLAEIDKSWTTADLSMMGLEKRDGCSGVFVRLNGRPFTMEDAEHPACGALYHSVSLTLPNRYCSIPSPSVSHCHPIPLYGTKTFFGPLGDTLMTIALDSVNAWKEYAPATECLPEVFLLRDEMAIQTALDASPELRLSSLSLYDSDSSSADERDDDGSIIVDDDSLCDDFIAHSQYDDFSESVVGFHSMLDTEFTIDHCIDNHDIPTISHGGTCPPPPHIRNQTRSKAPIDTVTPQVACLPSRASNEDSDYVPDEESSSSSSDSAFNPKYPRCGRRKRQKK